MLKGSIIGHILAGIGVKMTSVVTGLLAATLITYSGYVMYDTYYIQANAGNKQDLVELKPQVDEADPLASTLAGINRDYRAWLTLNDTTIDYPVMQGPDDMYYVSHDIYKNPSISGAIYLATGNSRDFSDNYNLVYGHNMANRTMFGPLHNYFDADFFNGHRTGVLLTTDKAFDLEIIAAMTTDAYEDMVYTVGNRNLASMIDFIAANAFHYDAEAAAGAEQIIAFSTCEDAVTNGRLVLFAKMIPRDPNAYIAAPSVNTNNEKEIADKIVNDNAHPSGIMDSFIPKGSIYGDRAWALVNLICVILTVYLLIPLTRIKGKVNRLKTMKKLSESGKYGNEYENKDVRAFRIKLTIGFLLEIIISIAAIVVFILTEDIRLPMVLIDKWTPLMLLILLICWVVDLLLIRNRKDTNVRYSY